MGTHWSTWLNKYPIERKIVDVQKDTQQDNFRFDSPIEASLDLHYLTQQEALQELKRFIDVSQKTGRRKVLIIHGKGHHSTNEAAVLKPLVQKYLTAHPAVKATGQAKLKNGGSGATWAILKT